MKFLFLISLKKLGWDKKQELKGRYTFSEAGDQSVSVKNRINFISEVASLSATKAGKTARIQVLVALEQYDKNLKEYLCYRKNLERIVKKIPKALSKNKSLIGVFYDQNDSIKAHVSDFEHILETLLAEKVIQPFSNPNGG